jgi:hypothetical protein
MRRAHGGSCLARCACSPAGAHFGFLGAETLAVVRLLRPVQPKNLTDDNVLYAWGDRSVVAMRWSAAMQHQFPRWVKMSRATHFVGTGGLPQ